MIAYKNILNMYYFKTYSVLTSKITTDVCLILEKTEPTRYHLQQCLDLQRPMLKKSIVNILLTVPL